MLEVSWPYCPATNASEFASRRAFAKFTADAAKKVNDAAAPPSHPSSPADSLLYEKVVLSEVRLWCDVLGRRKDPSPQPITSASPVVWAGLLVWLARSTMPFSPFRIAPPSVETFDGPLAAISACNTYANIGKNLVKSLRFAAQVPASAEAAAHDWTALCEWVDRRVLQFEPDKDDLAWREEAALVAECVQYVRSTAAALVVASNESVSALCAASVDLNLYSVTKLRQLRMAVEDASLLASLGGDPNLAEKDVGGGGGGGEEEEEVCGIVVTPNGGMKKEWTLAAALRAALVGHRVVLRIPRTQCRMRARKLLHSMFLRMSTHGTDLDVRRFSLQVYLSRPPRGGDDDASAVIWIRYDDASV